jgi:hypothetical protein
MRRRKLLVVALLVPAVVGAAAVGLHFSSSAVSVEVIRDESLDADRRLVTFKVRKPEETFYLCFLSDQYQARLRSGWVQPERGFVGVLGLDCVMPARAEACRLFLRAQRWSPSERARLLLERRGFAKRVPTLCDWVVCRLPDKRPPVRDVTVQISLPRRAHNEALHWTGGSRFSLLPTATSVAAAPGQ